MENLLLDIALAGYVLAAVLYTVWGLFKKDYVELIARWVLGAVALVLAASSVIRWTEAGRPPFSNLYESLLVFAFLLTLIHIVVVRKFNVKVIGFFTSFFGFLLLVYASRLDNAIRPLMPALKSNWLITHVATCFVAYAAFAISFICSLIYIAARRENQTDLRERLDLATYRSIAFGFFFLALGIITGAVWAEKAWGRYWGWDPKETWALISWLIYGFYLHMRVVKGWKGQAGAWIAIVGFAAVIFTYVGVAFWLPGLHSYASP